MNRRNFTKIIGAGLFISTIISVASAARSNQKKWQWEKSGSIEEYETLLRLLKRDKITLEEFSQGLIRTARFFGRDDGIHLGYRYCLSDIKRRKELDALLDQNKTT